MVDLVVLLALELSYYKLILQAIIKLLKEVMDNLEHRHRICVSVDFLVHSASLVLLEHLSTIMDMVFASHVKINQLILTTILLLKAQHNAVSNVLMALKQ